MALVRSDVPTASRQIRKTNRYPETPKRKRRPGRPSSYRPEYCDVVIEAGKEGWSLTATAAKIGVHRATLLDWGTAHPEFGDALKVHKAHRAHWWEERLRDVAKHGGAPGQVTACIFGLKNAVPEEWRDIQHQEQSGNTVAVHSCETPRCRLCGGGERRKLRRSDGRWGLVAMALDDPGLVGTLPWNRCSATRSSSMVSKRRTHSRFSLRVRMKRSTQPLPCGLAHESRRVLDAEEGELALVVVGDEPSCRGRGGASGRQRCPRRRLPKGGAHTLAQRLERLEAGRPARGVECRRIPVEQ